MSVFRVKLTNSNQGLLSGANQRSVFIMGPNKTNRVLKDGDTFTDVNYWKRFAYPQVSLEDAFIEIVTDDGIPYLDHQQVNFPKVYDITAEANSDYDENQADIIGETGGSAVFAQITNKGSEDVKIKLNNKTDAVIDLPAGSTQVFNAGDVFISGIKIKNESSSSVDVQILVSVAVIPTS
jgi:hypothetical protein